MAVSYIELFHQGLLENRAEEALDRLSECMQCPRECGVNRLEDETGFCMTGRKARVASFSPHFGEEAVLVGRGGSGTIFFSSCNLMCGFCQNFEISHLNEGVEVGPDQIAAMMLNLQKQGCHNINFVTPSHVVAQILEALPIAVEMGLDIPLVYNSSGYDKKETLDMLDGIFDIFMPDFKFWDKGPAQKYCNSPDYGSVAAAAVKEMHRQVGDLEVDDQGIAVKGLLIRHLVMPGMLEDSKRVIDFIAHEISKDCYVNIMDQYRPCGTAHGDDVINRRLTVSEFRDAMDSAQRAGLTRLDPRY